MTLEKVICAWLALAVVLTGATQLRPPGVPVGPGEALLAGWLVVAGFLLLGGRVTMGPMFRFFLIYWLAAFALLGFGALQASITGTQHRITAMHDGLAFVLAAAVTCFMALNWDRDGSGAFHLRLARYTFFICTAATSALLIVGNMVDAIGPVRFWYGGVRYAGWAKNPNQMALFAVAMPFLGWYLIEFAKGPLSRAIYLAAIAGSVAVGIASQSDALRVAWVGTGATVAGIFWLQSIARGRGRFLFIPYLLVPFLVIYLGITFGEELVREAEETMQRTYEEGDQGDTRISSWLNGLEVIRQSPLVGFGPGAYSGGPAPFLGQEAHNTYLDWGMSTGVAGVVLLLGMLVWCALRALLVGAVPLAGIVGSLALFSTFGYSLRQPIFWLLLVLVMTLTERRQASVAQANRAAPMPSVPGRPARGQT